MKYTEIKSCYIGPAISREEFIPEHFFLFLGKGKMNGYDGDKHLVLNPGECCIVRKNCLARYNKQKDKGKFEKVIIIFDEAFLKDFQKKHTIVFHHFKSKEAFIRIKSSILINNFLLSLEPYYSNPDAIALERKREELLFILLELNPGLSDILFDFGTPGRIDLEAFMQKNYKFNVSIDRLSFLTGRSLSAFKRDFKTIFNDTPSRWLVKKRLQEAYFLINQKNQKSTDFYLELGFEDLSHFSYAFKQQFGLTPTELAASKEKANS